MVPGAALTARPPLRADGHVVVVCGPWAPERTGSAVLMGNLLSAFDPRSYTVLTRRPAEASDAGQRVRGFLPRPASARLRRTIDRVGEPLLAARVAATVVHQRAVAVLGVYPDRAHLAAALRAATATGRPFYAYLHDTLAEGLGHTPEASRAEALQRAVFDAAQLLVMSQGMADLYRERYDRDSIPIVHTYPEPVPAAPPVEAPQPALFWGGEVYRINQKAVARVAAAARRVGLPFRLATRRTPHDLERQGVHDAETTFFAGREQYLQAVASHAVLVLALDGDDESAVHRDELATIFPTKTPEYLASGRPILVHCPEDWFLARFFRQHGCGLVVSDRAPQAMDQAIRRLLDPEVAADFGQAALRTARLFARDEVASRLAAAVAKGAVPR